MTVEVRVGVGVRVGVRARVRVGLVYLLQTEINLPLLIILLNRCFK